MQQIIGDVSENIFDGILGMAFMELQPPYNVSPPLFNAMQKKLLKKNLFTIYLNERDGKSVDGGKNFNINLFIPQFV